MSVTLSGGTGGSPSSLLEAPGALLSSSGLCRCREVSSPSRLEGGLYDPFMHGGLEHLCVSLPWGMAGVVSVAFSSHVTNISQSI